MRVIVFVLCTTTTEQSPDLPCSTVNGDLMERILRHYILFISVTFNISHNYVTYRTEPYKSSAISFILSSRSTFSTILYVYVPLYLYLILCLFVYCFSLSLSLYLSLSLSLSHTVFFLSNPISSTEHHSYYCCDDDVFRLFLFLFYLNMYMEQTILHCFFLSTL